MSKIARIAGALAFAGLGLGLGLGATASAAPRAAAPSGISNSTWTITFCWTTVGCATFTTKFKSNKHLSTTTLNATWSQSKTTTNGVTSISWQYKNGGGYPCHANYDGYMTSSTTMKGLQQTDDDTTFCLARGSWTAVKDSGHAPSNAKGAGRALAGVR